MDVLGIAGDAHAVVAEDDDDGIGIGGEEVVHGLDHEVVEVRDVGDHVLPVLLLAPPESLVLAVEDRAGLGIARRSRRVRPVRLERERGMGRHHVGERERPATRAGSRRVPARR